MHPTRQLWAVIALVGFLAVLAVVTARPLLLGGAGLVGAWVLTTQYRFLRALEATVDALAVQQVVGRTDVRTTETTPVTLSATLETASPLTLEIEGGLPTAAVSEASLSLSLEQGASRADRTVSVSWPVAGTHEFEPPTVTASNGFFRETLPVGPAPTVTVDPPEPRSVHVGEGGNRVATAYGEHAAGRLGSGIEPAELREYVPGDTADRIDWNATARLATPHVREFEAETDRRTLLIVDHRNSLATGPRGETKLDYLREVTLAIAASARRLGDPLGLVTVDDGGVTERIEPATTPATYSRVRRRLFDLEPTPENPATGDDRSPTAAASRRPSGRLTAADARATLATLDADDDAFAATLRPFYASREGYRQRIEAEPLYGAVEAALGRRSDAVWTILFTDDSRPTELREAVNRARANGNAVLVVIAPTVLYDPDGLADVERAYDRYVAFEELRRDLARMARVTALEAGPADRLSAVLSASRPRGGRA